MFKHGQFNNVFHEKLIFIKWFRVLFLFSLVFHGNNMQFDPNHGHVPDCMFRLILHDVLHTRIALRYCLRRLDANWLHFRTTKYGLSRAKRVYAVAQRPSVSLSSTFHLRMYKSPNKNVFWLSIIWSDISSDSFCFTSQKRHTSRIRS